MYAAAQQALYDLCVQQGTFTTATAFQDDWPAVLSIGETGLLIEQAGDTIEADQLAQAARYGSHGKRTQQHDIGAWVVVPIGTGQGGDAIAVQAVKASAESLADYIAAYGRLNGGTYVQRATVARIGAPVERLPRTQGSTLPTHVCVRIVVRVVTQRAWTMTEESN